MSVCKGRNCEAIDGDGHSAECEQDHSEKVNPDKVVIRKAIERYCEENGNPKDRCMMIVNAADMMDWLLNYDREYFTSEDAPELFAGTREALDSLSIKTQ